MGLVLSSTSAIKKKDADEDGISDRYDKCPNTPLAVVVDKNGCPLDKDKDGVADYLDECPDLSGTEQLKGCPTKMAMQIAMAWPMVRIFAKGRNRVT
ncbi:MAG: thrombospondin type 3 repeat-containing protein [Flammeovirgaceae bacterium]